MNRRLIMIVTLVAAIAVVAAIAIVPRLGTPGVSAQGTEMALESQPRKGPADAPVDVVVFEDFLCPHCGTFAENITPRIERNYVDDGSVAYYSKNFVVIGPESERIAQVGECVFEQGNDAFWTFEEVAFRSQDGLTEARAIALAEEYVTDLDADELRACIADGRGLDAVRADMEHVQALGLQGTPTVFVAGEQVRATYDDIAAAIEAALADAD